jgi:hypothetical protein
MGCLSMEPTQYLICQRSDTDWCVEEQRLIQRLSNEFVDCVQLGNFVAVASPRFKPNKTTSDMYSSFDIGRVQNVLEGSYSLLMYKRAPNSNIYVPNVLSKTIEVLHIDIRYYFEDRTKNLDSPVVLDIKIVQNIILNCFNGRM